MDIQSRRPTGVPLLKAWHENLDLAGTLQYRHWIVDNWKYFACSDKPRFLYYECGEKLMISMDPTCSQETVQSGTAFVMIWVVCSCFDMGHYTSRKDSDML